MPRLFGEHGHEATLHLTPVVKVAGNRLISLLGSVSPSLPLRNASPTSCLKQPMGFMYREHVISVEGRRLQIAFSLLGRLSRRMYSLGVWLARRMEGKRPPAAVKWQIEHYHSTSVLRNEYLMASPWYHNRHNWLLVARKALTFSHPYKERSLGMRERGWV